MKLYMLKQSYDHCYDEVTCFVIRATSPAKARKIASEHCAEEGPKVWLDKEYSTCARIKDEGPMGVLFTQTLDG